MSHELTSACSVPFMMHGLLGKALDELGRFLGEKGRGKGA